MNFRDDDADRSNYVFSVFSNAFYALYEVIEAVYCSVFLRVSRFSLCDLVCHRALKVYFVRARTFNLRTFYERYARFNTIYILLLSPIFELGQFWHCDSRLSHILKRTKTLN